MKILSNLFFCIEQNIEKPINSLNEQNPVIDAMTPYGKPTSVLSKCAPGCVPE
jgi:hypothetical protein